MISIHTIEDLAAQRHGGHEVLARRLSRPLSAAQIAQPDDTRWLSEMTRMIFQAGFNWRLIDNKWPDFEQAFDGFGLLGCAHLSDDVLEQKMQSGVLVRSWPKLKTIPHNAQVLLELSEQYGSVGSGFAQWQPQDYAHNLQQMQARTQRLGGKSLPVVLRRMGVDALIPAADVVGALQDARIIDGPLKSRRAWQQVQNALDHWGQESGYSLTEISQILGLSYGQINDRLP